MVSSWFMFYIDLVAEFNTPISHLIRDICLLSGEFVVVFHLKIFPLQLLGPAEKPMAGPQAALREKS